MQKDFPSINLSKSQTSLTDRFINWALTFGRLVIIITEVVALSAFIYRFSLDRQLVDLHSKITQEQAIVNYLKNSESNYRNLQSRLSLAANYSSLSQERIKIFSDVIGFAPQNMIFNSLSLFSNNIRIDADVSSFASLNTFINSLKNYPAIDTVSVDKIENKPSSAVITVNITATLKPNFSYADTTQ